MSNTLVLCLEDLPVSINKLYTSSFGNKKGRNLSPSAKAYKRQLQTFLTGHLQARAFAMSLTEMDELAVEYVFESPTVRRRHDGKLSTRFGDVDNRLKSVTDALFSFFAGYNAEIDDVQISDMCIKKVSAPEERTWVTITKLSREQVVFDSTTDLFVG
jgi:Holliday junction resolvase RusA-like endonuclease